MYRQTSMNGRHGETQENSSATSTANVVSNAKDVLHDATELVELQVRLFATDLKSAGRQSAIHIVVLLFGAICLLGVMPVLLMGMAELLVERFAFSRAQALFCSATGGLIVGGTVIVVGWAGLRKGLSQLSSSNEELARNLAWVKKMLKDGGVAD